jgi:hypothetical protein
MFNRFPYCESDRKRGFWGSSAYTEDGHWESVRHEITAKGRDVETGPGEVLILILPHPVRFDINGRIKLAHVRAERDVLAESTYSGDMARRFTESRKCKVTGAHLRFSCPRYSARAYSTPRLPKPYFVIIRPRYEYDRHVMASCVLGVKRLGMLPVTPVTHRSTSMRKIGLIKKHLAYDQFFNLHVKLASTSCKRLWPGVKLQDVF